MDAEQYEVARWHVMQAVIWACERESVLAKRQAGLGKPWTNDPIIRDYRFCNVSRQDDKETILLNDNFFRPNIAKYGDRDLWFNVAVARWINWSPTVIQIGWTDLTGGFNSDDLYERMKNVDLVYHTDKFFTGAYMVRGCTNAKEVGGDVELYEKCKDKRYFLANVVLKGIYEVGPPSPGQTLQSYHTQLTQAKSNGLFMAGQQIADLKYFNMRNAPDWETWAPWGPGPARLLNRMMGRALEKQIPKKQYYEELKQFDSMFSQELVDYEFDTVIKERVRVKLLDAHDRNSNLLCETDKMIRLQNGGRVRSGYNGKGETTTNLF